jgi:hypothetical protein
MVKKVLNNIEEVTAFKIDILLNNNLYTRMLANSRYISYRVIKKSFALRY